MCKRIEEQREATRAMLARRGQAVLAVFTVLLALVLMMEKALGISHETVLTLQAVFGLLVTLELMAFGHYFARRTTRKVE